MTHRDPEGLVIGPNYRTHTIECEDCGEEFDWYGSLKLDRLSVPRLCGTCSRKRFEERFGPLPTSKIPASGVDMGDPT